MKEIKTAEELVDLLEMRHLATRIKVDLARMKDVAFKLDAGLWDELTEAETKVLAVGKECRDSMPEKNIEGADEEKMARRWAFRPH